MFLLNNHNPHVPLRALSVVLGNWRIILYVTLPNGTRNIVRSVVFSSRRSSVFNVRQLEKGSVYNASISTFRNR